MDKLPYTSLTCQNSATVSSRSHGCFIDELIMRRLVSCDVVCFMYVKGEMCNSERGGEGTRGWVMLDAVDSSCSCYVAVRIVCFVRCRVLYVPGRWSV